VSSSHYLFFRVAIARKNPIDLQILFKSNSTPDVKRDQLGTHPTEVLTRSQATWQLLLAQMIEFTSVS
jgi:hypothetical protein